QGTTAMPLVLIILTGDETRRNGKRGTGGGRQGHRVLVDTDDRPLGIEGLGIEVEQVFHPGHEQGTHLRDAPLLLLPRLEGVFLRVRRTVSSEMEVTTANSTSRSAKRCMVQVVRPLGGSLQANATR